MRNRFCGHGMRPIITAGGLFFALALPGALLAQPPGGPPPPGGPGGFRPGPGGPPGMLFGRTSLANVPVGALDSELKLTDTQKQSIKQIQDKFQKDRNTLMPRPPFGGPPNGGPPPPGGPPNGGPPDFEQIRASMEKVRVLDDKASKQVEALLTEDQKKAVPDALKRIDSLTQAGLPPDLLGDLKLTADQKSRIVAISDKARQDLRQKMEEARQSGDFQSLREVMQTSRDQTHKQVMAVLTDSQKTTVDNYIKDHPMRGPGGFPIGPGGFGPPGGGPLPGGPGGPPPPNH